MFGELLSVAAIDRATALAQNAGLLLVVGSSLEVWPVAGLPEETLMHGGRLAIVNREPSGRTTRAPHSRCTARRERYSTDACPFTFLYLSTY